jgi:hypothetical protein
MRVRVVCGLSETIAIFSPMIRLEQRRLSRVGATDNRDEAGAHQIG